MRRNTEVALKFYSIAVTWPHLAEEGLSSNPSTGCEVEDTDHI